LLSRFFFWLHEDLFWCGLVGRLEREYRIPNRDVALGFAIEAVPEKSVQELDDRLPFGCHAWDKNSPEFWLQRLGEI